MHPLFAQSEINTHLKLRKNGAISGELLKERLFSYDIVSGQDTFQIKKLNIVKAYDYSINNGKNRNILRYGFYRNVYLSTGVGFSKRRFFRGSLINVNTVFTGYQLGGNVAYQLNSNIAVGGGAWMSLRVAQIDSIGQFRSFDEQFSYYSHIRLNYRFKNVTQNQLWLIANIGPTQEMIFGTTFYGKKRAFDVGVRVFRYSEKSNLFINFLHFEEEIREISLYFGYNIF